MNSLIHTAKKVSRAAGILQTFVFVVAFFLYKFECNQEFVAKGLWGVLNIIAFSVALRAFLSRRTSGLLLAIVGFNLGSIWFLFLEGIGNKEGTAAMLPAVERIHACAVAAAYFAISNISYFFILTYFSKTSLSINKKISSIHLPTLLLATLSVLFFLGPLLIIGSQYDSLGELWRSLTAGRSGGENGTLLRRTSLGGMEALFIPLMWAWQLSPAFSALAITSKINSKEPFSILDIPVLISGALVIFFTFLSGSRGGLMFVIAVPLMLWAYYGVRLGFRFWITSIVGFFFLIGVMEFQVKTRGNMLEALSSGRSADNGESLVNFDPTSSHRDNNLYFLCMAVSGTPDAYPYEGFNDFFAYLVNPIPRAIWPSKPILNGALLDSKDTKPVYTGGPLKVGTSSLTASVVGEAYLAHGYLGFIPYVFFNVIFMYWFDSWYAMTKRRSLIHIGLQGLACFMALWGIRGFGGFVTFVYPLCAVYFGLFIAATIKVKLHKNYHPGKSLKLR